MFNAYTKSINKMYNRTGSLFQEHLQRKRIENEEYLKQLVAYIHLNPVKHKFWDNFKLYRNSSYMAFLSGKSTVISRNYIISLFGDLRNFEKWHDLNKLNLDEKMEGI